MSERTATDRTATKRQAEYYQRKKDEGMKKQYFWLDEKSREKIKKLMEREGLTKDAAIKRLIKSGK